MITLTPTEMKINENAYRLKKLASLIETGNSGNPNELAFKIGVSRSTLYELLDDLQSLGLQIEYCRSIRSYRILNQKRLIVNYPVVKVVDIED